MGLWARDKADLEDWAPPRDQTLAMPLPPRVVHRCSQCGVEFRSEQDLADHRFDGHALERPALLFCGRELDQGRPVITEPSTGASWQLLRASEVWLNDRRSSQPEVVAHLSSRSVGVEKVCLVDGGVTIEYEIRFAIPDMEELDSADERFMELAYGDRLSLAAISSFVEQTSDLYTAREYVGGLCDYLYGVLNRDQPWQSGLREGQYREKYDSAIAALSPHRRPLAAAIVGLIAFHYNQFEEAVRSAPGTRVASASHRLQTMIDGHDAGSMELQAPSPADIDFALSDRSTEEVLGWSCMALNDAPESLLTVIEKRLSAHEPLDQRKLRMLLAEARLRHGDLEKAKVHVDELRHVADNDRWVEGIRRRMDEVRTAS